MKKPLDQYLQENMDKGIIDFSLRISRDSEGAIHFYMHPSYVSGDTVDYKVKDNEVIPK